MTSWRRSNASAPTTRPPRSPKCTHELLVQDTSTSSSSTPKIGDPSVSHLCRRFAARVQAQPAPKVRKSQAVALRTSCRSYPRPPARLCQRPLAPPPRKCAPRSIARSTPTHRTDPRRHIGQRTPRSRQFRKKRSLINGLTKRDPRLISAASPQM
jgi:hypothetical protein